MIIEYWFRNLYFMKNKRREFLKNVCPTVALAFFGVTMLEACSSGGEDDTDWRKW